jgi:peroxiredoxin
VNAEEAPDFTLPSGLDRELHLADLRGRPVVLAFYPADWSPVCSDQLSLYQAILHEFDAYDAALAASSVDSIWCHRAFAETRGLTFPLLSDFEPKGAVARMYDAYRSQDGFSERALFLLDPNGRIVWREVVAPEQNPGADGILRALDEMTARTMS